MIYRYLSLTHCHVFLIFVDIGEIHKVCYTYGIILSLVLRTVLFMMGILFAPVSLDFARFWILLSQIFGSILQLRVEPLSIHLSRKNLHNEHAWTCNSLRNIVKSVRTFIGIYVVSCITVRYQPLGDKVVKQSIGKREPANARRVCSDCLLPGGFFLPKIEICCSNRHKCYRYLLDSFPPLSAPLCPALPASFTILLSTAVVTSNIV